MSADFPRIILVQTQISGNLGAVARTMMNLGFSDLHLVNPLANHLNRESMERAVHARGILESCTVHLSLREAIADCEVVVGTSRKRRKSQPITFNPLEFAQHHQKRGSLNNKMAFVFGPEDRGLENEDIALCDALIDIPTADAFPSLNLSHAVAIVLYAVYSQTLVDEKLVPAIEEVSTKEEREEFYDHLHEALDILEYHNPQNPQLIMRDLKNIFNRCDLNQREVRILRGICRQIMNKIHR